MVYVRNKDGKPLMPTERHGKVRRMLRDGQAKVIRREPFIIQLLYGTSEYTQPITLGVDAGSNHIGLSASTARKELYAGDVQLRTDITEKLSTRREKRDVPAEDPGHGTENRALTTGTGRTAGWRRRCSTRWTVT